MGLISLKILERIVNRSLVASQKDLGPLLSLFFHVPGKWSQLTVGDK